MMSRFKKAMKQHMLLSVIDSIVKRKGFKKERQEEKAMSTAQGNYFAQAKSWADDYYTLTLTSRNRYRIAFFFAMGLCALLSLSITILVPLEHYEPLLIHHYPDGRTSVEVFHQKKAPIGQARIQSDIVTYLVHRESYDPDLYDVRYKEVIQASSSQVGNAYLNAQNSSNKNAPINVLGKEGHREVHVDSLIFLDKASLNNPKHRLQHHINLAQVNFTIRDYVSDPLRGKTKAFTALISWRYRGTPKDPAVLWQNPYGFTVTRYTVEQRNL